MRDEYVEPVEATARRRYLEALRFEWHWAKSFDLCRVRSEWDWLAKERQDRALSPTEEAHCHLLIIREIELLERRSLRLSVPEVLDGASP